MKIRIAIFGSGLDLRLMVKRLISLRFPCGCCALLIMSCIKFLYFDGYDICAEFIGKLPPHFRTCIILLNRQNCIMFQQHKLFFPLCKFHSYYNLSKYFKLMGLWYYAEVLAQLCFKRKDICLFNRLTFKKGILFATL